MNRFARIALSSAVLAFAALPACTDSGTEPGTNQAASTSGRAHIKVVVTGETSSSLDLTATDSTTGEVSLTQHLTLETDGSVGIDVELPEGDYDFDLTSIGDDGISITGTGSFSIAIAADASLDLSAVLDGAGGGGGIETDLNHDPEIQNVAVSVINNLTLGLNLFGDATLTGTATDEDGDEVTYFWSGLTIEGSVEGNAALHIDNDDMLAARLSGALAVNASAHFFLTVTDGEGGSTVADVTIGGNGTCLLCGDADFEIIGGAEDTDSTEEIRACLDAQVSCSASCDALVEADEDNTEAGIACETACGAELSACVADAY